MSTTKTGYDTFVAQLAGRSSTYSCATTPARSFVTPQCGCKGFQLGPARVLGLLGFYDRFVYDAEMLYLADQVGIAITPVRRDLGRHRRIDPCASVETSLKMIRDLRTLVDAAITRTPWSSSRPTVDVHASTDAARASRVQGWSSRAVTATPLVVLPTRCSGRGIGIAGCSALRCAPRDWDELRGRRFDAVNQRDRNDYSSQPSTSRG